MSTAATDAEQCVGAITNTTTTQTNMDNENKEGGGANGKFVS